MRLVDSVILTNTSESLIENITVTVSLENDECLPWTRQISRVESGSTFRVEPEDLKLSAKSLAFRTEAERTSILVLVETDEKSCSSTFQVDLLPFDQWPGIGHYPELTAAFVTPNHPLVADLLKSARESLRTLSDRDALDGYQSESRQRAAMIAEACFNALSARNIGYINPPASFEQDGQRVRLIDRICREEFGTCLDLAFLLAGLWEQCGLHPLILLLEGHAIPAIWTHKANLPETVIDEPARIRNLIELGEIVPVESTVVTHQTPSFSMAVDAAKNKMDSPGNVFCAVDIKTCRKHGVRPLPLRVDGETTTLDLNVPADNGIPVAADTKLDRVVLAERAEARRDEADIEADSKDIGRIARWQTKLLDLSLRNRLINFRQTGRTIQLVVPDVAQLEDMLADDKRFSVFSKVDGDTEFFRKELGSRHLYTDIAKAETQKRMLTLYRTAKTSIEETGANLLHLAVGMLKWYETESSDTPRYAPLILLPVRLTRHATGSGYRYDLGLSDEPLRPNVTLLQKLRNDFGIDTDGLEDLPEDESGIDVPLILRNFRSAIRESSRWEVEESTYLGLFSFNKFLMWRDLQENIEQLKKNRLVGHLVNRSSGVFDSEPFPKSEELDSKVKPSELFCTRDADSTQLAAVQAAAEKRTFVLEGPPGTGKSQTIANIIADSLARGKRVLFVAEKMAALSVVRKRLEDDGLGPYCLELHSAKGSKKEVLAQLEEGLDVEATPNQSDWYAMCDELGVARVNLNTYVHELHLPRGTGESLYRVLGRLSQLGDGATIKLPSSDVGGTTKEQLELWRQSIAVMDERSQSVDPPHLHPLRGIGQSQWSFNLPSQAKDAIEASQSARDKLDTEFVDFVKASGSSQNVDTLSGQCVQSLVMIANLLLTSPSPNQKLLVGHEVRARHDQIRNAVKKGELRDQKRARILERYREEFLGIEHLVHIDTVSRANSMPGPLKFIFGFLAKKKIRPYATASLPDLNTLKDDLETAREQKMFTEDLKQSDEVAALIGHRWNNGNADWESILKLLEWCEQYTKALHVLARDPLNEKLVKHFVQVAIDQDITRTLQSSGRAVAQAWNQWTTSWKNTKTVLSTSSAQAFGNHQGGWFPMVEDTLKRWLGSASELNNWCSWMRSREQVVALGLDDLVKQYESGEIARPCISDTFERTFGKAWFIATADKIDSIRNFNATTHSNLIDRFRQLDKAIINQTRYVVGEKLKSNAPSSSSRVSAQSEMGILRREIQKKRRHLPTRRLIEAMPNLLPRLKPCFLMSPLSIAQYLDASLPPFDLVVFDEASQIPVWDSIGAIARGTNVIIVGDSKQLPPTNFFGTIDGDEDADIEDMGMDDMESILKECNASGIPSMRLRWHYRSRHESLITFSNHHYYENKLLTFPSPTDRSDTLGVTLQHVPNGVYDRGGSRTNKIEAEEVVNKVVDLLKGPDKEQSIGVVTFNQAQQSLIEDLLDQKRRENPDIEPFFTSEVHEPVFIKNLENVQGDERDTIIFSVGYGPDQTGKPSMNFGPLNKDGGERRLNVAVTRARCRLMVFTSILSDQIDLRRTQSVGVKHFKTFLDYADRGPRAIAEAIEESGSRDFDSDFEQAVWKALIDRGWEVDTQIGSAGYRIDLAVRDPERPGRFIMGIECDGAAYHSAKTARDRDRLRQSVLEGLGWRIERIWSTDWWIEPQRCIDKIEKALEDAKLGIVSREPKLSESTHSSDIQPDSDLMNETEIVVAETLPDDSESVLYASGVVQEEANSHSNTDDGLFRYRIAIASDPRLARLDIFEPSSKSKAVAALSRIIQEEGPIVEELAMRRLAEWFGVKRITNRFKKRYSGVQSALLSSRSIKREGDTLWAASLQLESYFEFRVPTDDPITRRDIDHIPLVERVNAVVHILNEQFGLPIDELQREVARIFGWQKLTSKVNDAAKQAIDEAVRAGKAKEQDSQIMIV